MNAEEKRLEESRTRTVHWRRWGPYLSERQWGTVREDYSPDGDAWNSFPHDHARSRAYRWGEDGIAGISDRHQFICFSLALWNGKDPILKERLFGLTGKEGNHGEDVKEYYFYLDSTPTHSYMKFLYKYPQDEFPYAALLSANRSRGRGESEFELLDTGIFDQDRYFDITVEYAKATQEDICIRITVDNRAAQSAPIHLLPTVWFRNTWSWDGNSSRPTLNARPSREETALVEIEHSYYGRRWLACQGRPELLFTENETNSKRLWATPNPSPWVKDGINDYVVQGVRAAVNPEGRGTKGAAYYSGLVGGGGSWTLKLRLTDKDPQGQFFGREFDSVLAARQAECDDFYATKAPRAHSEDALNIQRQAFAGLLWNKQYYHYDVRSWLKGDATGAAPPPERQNGRNHGWKHLYNADVISMPDKWEYPWYASWDLAFHCIPLALIDPDFAKQQLVLLLREWYMHPNGQIPAYEWSFSDVNPPLHAWAAWRVYKIDRRVRGKADRSFLERVFHKLLLNFTWWVNRKDVEGNNVFQGGFLGLDNIGVFDRSAPLPAGGHLEQSDSTSWMAMYSLNMLAMALELARENKSYSDVASKFFEHFVYIAHAMNHLGPEDLYLWDEADGFYYDVLHMANGSRQKIKVRSMVGLIPLFAVESLQPDIVDALPDFQRRMQWFIENRPEFRDHCSTGTEGNGKVRRLLSLVNKHRLIRVLERMLDEQEFLSPHGIRSLSHNHQDEPYVFSIGGEKHQVEYQPAESDSTLFGGNSNWRGPIWFPVNFLLIESLQKFHHFHGDDFKVAFPSGSGRMASLWEVAAELSRRLSRIFLSRPDGRRPLYGRCEKFQTDPHWRQLIQFHEYFHGENGSGLGASHQTGWTALVAKLLQQSGC